MRINYKCGTQIFNWITYVIFSLRKRQLAIIRSISLGHTAYVQYKINGTVKVESGARAAFQDVGIVELIALQHH